MKTITRARALTLALGAAGSSALSTPAFAQTHPGRSSAEGLGVARSSLGEQLASSKLGDASLTGRALLVYVKHFGFVL